MKTLITLASVIVILANATSLAQAQSLEKSRGSIKENIIYLYNNYKSIDKTLKELEENVRKFPNTTLHFSVNKSDKDLRLISIELFNNDKLLKSHIYALFENEALDAGSRHQLYREEIREGNMTLKVIARWKEGNRPPQKSETTITIFASTGKEYFVELTFKKIQGEVKLRYSRLDFNSR